MPGSLDSLRERLEERADLLEATRLRYRALGSMVRAFFWRERVRANLELLREVVRAEPEVEATLEAVHRRAAAERWPPRSAPMRLLAELARWRRVLERALRKRLAPQQPLPSLAESLLRLEEQVLAAGPLLGQRLWSQATELLPRNLPELRTAAAAAEVLERIFKRPLSADALPFTSEEATALCQALSVADATLASLWARLRRYDPKGRVHELLRHRSRRAPLQPPRSGPELLLYAAFWQGLALSRLQALLESRLGPLSVAEEELPTLLSWLVARESSAEARLPASAQLSEGRAALLELAAELATLSRSVESPHSEAAWARLEAAAWRARSASGPDVERLRQALRFFIRLRGQSRTPARLFSPARARIPTHHMDEAVEDLPGLVQRARAAARGALLPPESLVGEALHSGRGRG